MNIPDPKPLSSVRARRINAPSLILAIALILTGVATFYVNGTTRFEDRLRFDSLVRQTNANVSSRIDMYVSLLCGASGLFAAKPDTNRVEFRDYVDRLGPAMHAPGIRGIGFTKRILPGSEQAVIQSMRAQGSHDFHFWSAPGASSKPSELYAVLFVEPEDARNQTGLGFNAFSEPARRTAMQAAADSGAVAATSRLLPVRPNDPNQQPIVIIYNPVYRGGTVPATTAERRRQLIGYVYSPFRSDDFLQGIFGNAEGRRFNVSVYDGTTVDPTKLLHHSDALPSAETAVMAPPDFTDRTSLTVVGEPWTLVYTPGASFEAGDIHLAPYVFLAGLIMSGLLFSIARAQLRSRLAAEDTTSRLRLSDAARRASEARAQRLIESNIIGVIRAGFDGTILEANDALLELSGYTRADMNTGAVSITSLTAPEMLKRTQLALLALHRDGIHPPFESILKRRDGEFVPIYLGATRLEDADREQFIGFILDISERKEAQELMRENEIRQRAFLRDVLASVTEGKLRLCYNSSDLPRCLKAIGEPITLTRPSLRLVRQITRQAAEKLEMPIERLQDLITAVGEASMNAVAHAGGGTAYVGAEGDVVQVWIEDQGTGIDMGTLPRATLERGYTTAGSLGHGFFLMLKTIDCLWLLTGPDGTTVVIEQNVHAEEPNWLNSPPSVTQSAKFEATEAR